MQRSSDWWCERMVGTGKQAPIEPTTSFGRTAWISVSCARGSIFTLTISCWIVLADTSSRCLKPGMLLPFSKSVVAVLLPAFI